MTGVKNRHTARDLFNFLLEEFFLIFKLFHCCNFLFTLFPLCQRRFFYFRESKLPYSLVSRFISRGLVSSAILGERERTALIQRIERVKRRNSGPNHAAGDFCQYHIAEPGHIFNVLHFHNFLYFFLFILLMYFLILYRSLFLSLKYGLSIASRQSQKYHKSRKCLFVNHRCACMVRVRALPAIWEARETKKEEPFRLFFLG